MNYKKVAISYANDILNDVIPACEHTKKVCQQFLDDLVNPKYYYNSAEVNGRIVFAHFFYLTEVTPRRKTKLERWQIFEIVYIFGFYKHSTRRRKARIVYLEVARGNGKTQLYIIMGLYELRYGYDAQVVLAANTNKQAFEVDFDKATKLVLQIDPDQEEFQIYESSHRIVFRKDGNVNKLIMTSNESKPVDGLGGSFMIVDEMHEMVNLEVYNVLKTSQSKRSDSLLVITTTAGKDTESECYRMRNYGIDILNKIVEDDSRLYFIYTIDKDDLENIEDKNVWIKANPNLNVSVFEDVIESEIKTATRNDSERSEILRKYLNVWLKNKTEEVWIEEESLVKAFQEFDMFDEKFKDCDLWVGVDLASVSDLVAVSYMYELNKQFYFHNDYYICENNDNNITIKQMFKEAAALGLLTLTAGNATDYNYITKILNDVEKKHHIREISYDSWNSIQWAIENTGDFSLIPYSQNPGSVHKPLSVFKHNVLTGNVIMNKNYITKWCCNNVILRKNYEGNYKIDKSNNNKKIDGVAAMMNALGNYLRYYMNDDGGNDVTIL